MAATFTLSGDLATIVGANIDPKAVEVYVEASEPAITDTTAHVTRVGSVKATVNADGTWEAPGLLATNATDIVPAPVGGETFKYRVLIRYINARTVTVNNLVTGWFDLTANTKFDAIDERELTTISAEFAENIIGDVQDAATAAIAQVASSTTAATSAASAASSSATAAQAAATAAQAVGTTNDAIMRARALAAPAPDNFAGALAASFAATGDTLALRRLADQGRAELAASAANQRIDYEDAAQLDERWPDLTAWPSAGSHAVAGGKMYSAAGGVQQMGRTYQPATSRFRLMTKLDLPSGLAGSGFVFIGFSQNTAGAQPVAADTIGIGVDPVTYRPIMWKGSNFAAVAATVSTAGATSSVTTSSQTAISTVPFTPGTVQIEIIGDETQVSFVIHDLAHTVEHRFTIPRTAWSAINNLAIWSGDIRNAAGIAMHPVGIKSASATLKPRTIAAGTTTTTLTEAWADLSNWAYTAGGQVSGGKEYSKGLATPTALCRPIPAGLTALAWTSTITVSSQTGATGLMFLGVTTDASATVPTAANMFGIGVDASTKVPISWQGTGAGGANSSSPTVLGTALAAGDYKITVTLTSTSATLSLTSTDGATVYGTVTKTFVQLGSAPTTEIVWNSNSAASAGVYVGQSVGATSIAATYANNLTYEGSSASVIYTKPLSSSSSLIRVHLPAGYDSRKPLPLVIHAHGHGRTAISAFDDSQNTAYFKAIAAAGYIVVSVDAQGSASWGKPTAVADYEQAYRYVRDHYAISGVILHGISMGGLSCLSILGRRVIPNILGYYGVAPVCSLRKIFDADWNGTFKAEVVSAFALASDGSDFAAKTAGYAPETRQGWEFRGVPIRLALVNDDTVVPPADHGLALLSKVAPYASEATHIDTATGGHISDGAYSAADTIAAFARWTLA